MSGATERQISVTRRAARIEAAARRIGRDRGHDARDLAQPLPAAPRALAEPRQGIDQALRVGMARRGEDRSGRLRLDDAAGIHHGDPPAHVGDQPEIVADHQDGGALGGAQLGHQVDDLGLHRDVERRGRLVGDQQLGPAGQRNGDHDPLAHAAGELVRIIADAPLGRGHADLAQAPPRRDPSPRSSQRPRAARTSRRSAGRPATAD